MTKQIDIKENEIVETIKLKLRTPEERLAFIQGRITGIKTVLDLIKGELMERVATLHEIEVALLENKDE